MDAIKCVEQSPPFHKFASIARYYLHTVAKPVGCERFVGSRLIFGPTAFTPLCKAADIADSVDCSFSLQSQVAEMVIASVDGAATMRGQRGERLATEMMSSWCTDGLWMHGDPTSPLNSLIIPAIRHIYFEMAKLPPRHAKRIDFLSTLVHACQDCQQVQAREILRIFGDLTAQNATLEEQLKYSLLRLKEAALNCYISRRHPTCDLDWTQVAPWQQRPHLWSGYVSLIGESFGLDGVTAANSDRFRDQALSEIACIEVNSVLKELRDDLAVDEWLQVLIADINNQADGADRLIDRGCIFKWAQANMSADAAHLVFYDEDRAYEFTDQTPNAPLARNRFQPFLSHKVLEDILIAAGMLERTDV